MTSIFDEASKYIFVLTKSAPKNKGVIEAFLLLSQLEGFVNGPLEQIKRVERAHRSVNANAGSEQ